MPRRVWPVHASLMRQILSDMDSVIFNEKVPKQLFDQGMPLHPLKQAREKMCNLLEDLDPSCKHIIEEIRAGIVSAN